LHEKKTIAIILTSICYLPQTVFAWGADGHQSIGAIADALLSGSKASAQVKALLGNRSLEQVSVWADCAKGISPEKDFSYTVPGRFQECQPFENPTDIQLLADFVKRNTNNCNAAPDEESCHKQYHYADVTLQESHYKTGLVGTNDHDIVHAIQASIAVLKESPLRRHFKLKMRKKHFNC